MVRKLILPAFFLGLATAAPAAPSRLPDPIVIQGRMPTTETLREELLEPRLDRMLVHDSGYAWNLTASELEPETDSRLPHYLDGHLLEDLRRIDNPYQHNKPGIGFGWDI